MSLILFCVIINYRVWEEGRFGVLKMTFLIVITACLITFGAVCSDLTTKDNIGFIWSVFGSSVTLIALAWSVSTQLTIEDELSELRIEHLRLNNNQCIETSRFVKDLLIGDCTNSNIQLSLKSVKLIKNIIDNSGNKSPEPHKSELKRLEYRLKTVILSLEKSLNKEQASISSNLISDFEAIIDLFLDINTRL